MKKSIVLALGNSVALAGVLTVNALANILPINGMNTGQVSALYPSLFTPAGITFSIWSVIYGLLIGFVIFQWIKRNDMVNSAIIHQITPFFLLSCIFNMAWIIAWHYLWVWASVLIMLGLLITLIIIFLHVKSTSLMLAAQQWFIDLPFTVYLAWICVATIANIATALVASSWGGFRVSPEYWTVIMMTIAAALASFITIRYTAAVAFAAVIHWALVGITLRTEGSSDSLIEGSALVLIMLLSGVILFVVLKRLRLS